MSLPITTERLIIRPCTLADFAAMHAVWSDPAVMALIPSEPYGRAKSWARLSESISHQARHGFSKWAVVEAASGTVIGECGVHYFDGGPDIELGYRLARAHWRQGFAAEAAQACLDWALVERPERIVAIVDPANTRSARILHKIGMIRDGTFSRSGHNWDFYVAIRCPAPHARPTNSTESLPASAGTELLKMDALTQDMNTEQPAPPWAMRASVFA